MTNHMKASLTLLGMIAALTGCNDSVGTAGCQDFVRTIGDVAVRCGFDRQANEDAAEESATAGYGCGAVVSLRDEEAFYDSCLPYVEGLTCEQFDDPATTFPSSCSMQLEVRR